MKRSLIAPLFLIMMTALATAAEAAPTIDDACQLYYGALERRGFPLDRQGFLFETLEGESLLSCNAEQFFNPASVVKLATSAAAIERLGPDYRFPTAFYTNGSLDPATGELQGDLILLGSGDPVFLTENAFLVARELRARGISRVTGDLVVKGPFYCNYSTNVRASAAVVKTALDPEKWNRAVENAFDRYRMRTNAAEFAGVAVDGEVVIAHDLSVMGMTPLFTHRSAPLVKILKQLNNYSNNWMSHVVGWKVGGAAAVGDTVATTFGVPRSAIRLASTSGLGSNGMRPMDVTRLLRGWVPRLSKLGYAPQDLMPVAGRDPGTLEDRYLLPGVNGSVVGKTGTLSGVSTLAGYMYTRDRGIVVFSIMNRGGSPYAFRPLQDQLVRDMLAACGGPAPLPYARPVAYRELAGAVIERAPGDIPVTPQASLVGGH